MTAAPTPTPEVAFVRAGCANLELIGPYGCQLESNMPGGPPERIGRGWTMTFHAKALDVVHGVRLVNITVTAEIGCQQASLIVYKETITTNVAQYDAPADGAPLPPAHVLNGSIALAQYEAYCTTHFNAHSVLTHLLLRVGATAVNGAGGVQQYGWAEYRLFE